jgi:hypothetical protein
MQSVLPTLTLETCPFGHEDDCKKEWVSPMTGHRLVCECPCHKKDIEKKMKKVRAGSASPTSTNGTDTYRLTHVVNNFSCKANKYYDFTPSRRTSTIRLAVKRHEQVGAVAERMRGNYQNWNVIHLNHCGRSTLLNEYY